MLITENQLDEWVRGNSRDAQGVIVELVWRLVAASSPRPNERRFPLGDSIGQPGPDGVLDVNYPYLPFVPEGRSFWEIGTGLDAGAKATKDYRELTNATPASVRQDSVFVFVTPLSGRRSWAHTWEKKAQARWLKSRRSRNEWKDVFVIDGTKLIDWLHHFPAVELWLGNIFGLSVQQIETAEQRWNVLKSIGEPPPLNPEVFLANRVEAVEKLKQIFSASAVQLEISTHYLDQVVDFIAAFIGSMDEQDRIDAVSRTLVISGVDAWNQVVGHREPQIMVADPRLDLNQPTGTMLLEKARRAGHAVIYGGVPGGIPHPNRVPIPNPKTYQLQEALERAGYKEERARTLARRSAGNLGSLLRCLQNLSLMPEWAETSAAAELAVAELLGSWNETSDADKAAVEYLAGKPYGEWIGTIRDVARRPGTPLTLRDGFWKFTARFEGWYALGPRLFDEHLKRLKQIAVTVLSEKDPKFELEPQERYAAQVHGKVLAHSNHLRNGLAESLALLGSHASALEHCTFGRAAQAARLAVREILGDADWVIWATLDRHLPLLAEAAPDEFLDVFEQSLRSTPHIFDELFAQEDSGFMGATYMSGLLWALETLAWDPEYLIPVAVCLGELAARDPGGNWANRPANSLTTILLPWLPQTCAPIEKRKTTVETLLAELPDVGWKLLLSLLPNATTASSGTHRPVWRETIPDDWSREVPVGEYFEQVRHYSELAVSAARGDIARVVQLIDRMNDLSGSALKQLLAYLASDEVLAMPDDDRLELWMELVDLATKHKKYADAKWSMDRKQINEIEEIAERITPRDITLRYQRLFGENDFDLYEDRGNFREQQHELGIRRQAAVQEIFDSGGTEAVIRFAESAQSPWRVGIAFGFVAGTEAEAMILPRLLADDKFWSQFIGGYVWGRFRSRGWQWVDSLDVSQWNSFQIGQFLTFLPFNGETWKRSASLLGKDEAEYWSKVSANPYEAESGLDKAVAKLIDYGRPLAAIRSLDKMRHDGQAIKSELAVRALLSAIDSSEDPRTVDTYEIGQVIEAVQDAPDTNQEDLFSIEWAYLPLLERTEEISPKLLERRLSQEPDFFCEVVRLVYRSKFEEKKTREPTEQEQKIGANAYRLLSRWKRPPGTRDDKTYDADALEVWLAAVKNECRKTGHFEVAMITVGHVLINAPLDRDGLWIHHAAAAALNAKDAGDMRDGFSTALFNARGVHGFSAGEEEQKIAGDYRSKADAVEARGYHRLAKTLRELARSYEYDARRESIRDPFGE